MIRSCNVQAFSTSKNLNLAAGTNGAELLALRPHIIGPAGDDALDFVRPSRRGQIKVNGVHSPNQQIPHHATHQIDLMPGRAKPIRQRSDFFKNRGETIGYHVEQVTGRADPQL